jgi:hypothetical protein
MLSISPWLELLVADGGVSASYPSLLLAGQIS